HHGRVPVGGPGSLGDHRAADGGRQARDVDAVLDRQPYARCSGSDAVQTHDPGRAAAVVIHSVIVARGVQGVSPRASAAKKSRTLRLEVMAAAALRSSYIAPCEHE